MSHFESPECCYDFHSFVKCFSPLNCCLALGSYMKALTLEIVRMNTEEQGRPSQWHKILLKVFHEGDWKASEQCGSPSPNPACLFGCLSQNPEVVSEIFPIMSVWSHKVILGCVSPGPTGNLLLSTLWHPGAGVCSPVSSLRPKARSPFREGWLCRVHPSSSEMTSNYLWILHKIAIWMENYT